MLWKMDIAYLPTPLFLEQTQTWAGEHAILSKNLSYGPGKACGCWYRSVTTPQKKLAKPQQMGIPEQAR